jgi:hydroxyacylglutathione hydrolase
MHVEMFCGGIAETNGYLISEKGSAILIDAPEGMADWAAEHCRQQNLKPEALFITHGHWDHIVDALQIKENMKIPVLIHQDSAPLLETPAIQKPFNPFYQLKPCKADRVLKSEDDLSYGPLQCKTYLCPGHCPGSLCFYFESANILFPGDVLFSSGVGRWDLPGGSQSDLTTSIKTKLYPLPEMTEVYPGHGTSTTIGKEKKTNPFVR